MPEEVTLKKMTFHCESNCLNGGADETMWVKPLPEGGDNNLYEIENSPFYMRNISYLDIVSAEILDGILLYKSTIKSGGHSTYRLLVRADSKLWDEWWHRLAVHGCTYEFGHHEGLILYAVDVPGNANIDEVYKILSEGEVEGAWVFEEGHFGHAK